MAEPVRHAAPHRRPKSSERRDKCDDPVLTRWFSYLAATARHSFSLSDRRSTSLRRKWMKSWQRTGASRRVVGIAGRAPLSHSGEPGPLPKTAPILRIQVWGGRTGGVRFGACSHTNPMARSERYGRLLGWLRSGAAQPASVASSSQSVRVNVVSSSTRLRTGDRGTSRTEASWLTSWRSHLAA